MLPLLHIDDSRHDRVLVREAIALSRTPFEYNGADGMESGVAYFEFYHRKTGPRPVLVLLDYDLGGYTGVDFIYWLRVLKKMSSISVVMLSGSVGESHIAQCYAAGADFFLCKPGNLERLKLIVRTLHVHVVSHKQPGPIPLLKEYKAGPRESAKTAVRISC